VTLRTRLAVLTASLVAVAVVAVAGAAWLAARAQLRGEIDEVLQDRAARLVAAPRALPFGVRRADRPSAVGPRGTRALEDRLAADPLADVSTFFQVVTPEGTRYVPRFQPTDLPIDNADEALARSRDVGAARLRDSNVDGLRLRIITAALPNGGVVQVARTLDEVDAALRGLGVLLGVFALAGVGAAAGAGAWVARRSLRPVEGLTRAAENVARTQALEHRIEVERDDELGRLAGAFNAMLAALDESRVQQHQLVQDASHELRTPLTSLRTNIEMLERVDQLEPGERQALMADLRDEVADLSALIGELVDLATDRRDAEEEMVDVRLDEVVERVADRARRRSGLGISLTAAPTLVRGRPALLERAVSNLLDNACKFGADGGGVDVAVRADGAVEVADRGPGIRADDRDRIFDRFFRAEAARSRPGSGLGLAIVRQVVEDVHGGEVFAWERDGGGAVVGFRIPAEELNVNLRPVQGGD
jgi:two-component system sensor histidine kinase MprB